MTQSNATQTFVCALTGTSPLTDPVVTPSGYICSRKLLLTKLAENGGSDPFDSSSNNPRQLDESTLIELSTNDNNGSNCVPPRPPTATSLPSLLGMVQNEFDAVLLELYDTRKALEETRRELSSALYQNDAAVRVVARIVKERDEARSKLEEFLSSDAVKQREMANNNKVTEQQPQKRGREEEDSTEGGGITSKKAKTIDEEGAADALSRIPSSELSAMTSTWKVLTKGRKAIAKLKRSEEEIAKNEKVLSDLAEGNEKKVNLGKSSAKAGVLCIKSVKSGDKEYIITGSHDKTAIVYNVTEGKIVTTLSGAGGVVNVVDAMAVDESILVATGSADGMVTLCSVPLNGDDSSLLGSVELAKGTPVQVTIHPSSTGNDEARILVASSEGSIELYKSVGKELKLLSRLESEEGTKYTSGCLHPDGLIYIAGTIDGSLVIWDLKSSAAAGTMKGHDGSSVDSITVSENGYHVASSSSATPNAPVCVWDLRKLKLSATITPTDVGVVTSVSFDPTASYLAYSGEESTKVCVVKDWERVVCTLKPSKSGRKGKKKGDGLRGGVAWGGQGFGLKDGEGGSVWLSTGCDGERPVRFFGVE